MRNLVVLAEIKRKDIADLYRAKLRKVLDAAENLEDSAVKDAMKLIEQCRKQVAAELNSISAKNWKQAHAQKIIDDMDKIVDDFSKQLGKIIPKEQKAMAGYGDKAVLGMAPDKWPGYVHVAPEVPLLMQDYTVDLIQGLNAEMKKFIAGEIRLAILKGDTPYDVMETLGRNITTKGTRFRSAAYRAELIVRTELSRAHAQHSQLTLETAFKKDDELKKIWIANVGACDECASLDGKVFEVDETNPSPPLHPNCRCRICGYKKDWFEE